MKRTILIGVIFLSPTVLFSQTIFGKWKTIDDNSGKQKSIVAIFEQNGKAFGKVVELFREPGEDPDPICEECEDQRKNQKVKGMIIINDMEKGDDEWADGQILDPDNGKIYRCKLWLVNAKTLKVRGYWGFLFRTQTWYRAE